MVTLEIKDEKDRKNCKTISKCIRCGMGKNWNFEIHFTLTLYWINF